MLLAVWSSAGRSLIGDGEAVPSPSPMDSRGGTINYAGTVDLTDAKEREVEVEIHGVTFSPTVITGRPGDQLVVGVGNEGNADHTFTIDGVIDDVIPPGEEHELQVDIPTEGAVTFYCRYHREQGMAGILGTPESVGASLPGS